MFGYSRLYTMGNSRASSSWITFTTSRRSGGGQGCSLRKARSVETAESASTVPLISAFTPCLPLCILA